MAATNDVANISELANITSHILLKNGYVISDNNTFKQIEIKTNIEITNTPAVGNKVYRPTTYPCLSREAQPNEPTKRTI